MANTGRFVNHPAAKKIRGNRRTFRQWLLRRFNRREVPEIFSVVNVNAAYYPAGYKK